MQNDVPRVTIVHARVSGDLPEAGIKQDAIVYLAWDWAARRFFVVQWNRVRWVCSCGTLACAHKLAANTYVFELSVKEQAAKSGAQS